MPGVGQVVAALPAAPAGAPAGWALGSSDNPAPRYPSAARRRGIQGIVTLAVRVAASGLPVAVEVAASSGSTLLDEAALEAVRRWRFQPATAAGRPVEASLAVPVEFRLVDP
jgi:protein TonB